MTEMAPIIVVVCGEIMRMLLAGTQKTQEVSAQTMQEVKKVLRLDY